MLNKKSKIYIAGHKGMVGSACWRLFQKSGYENLIGKSSKELDLRNRKQVKDFLHEEKPELIIDSAAKVGGILANNTYPYEFLSDNLSIQNNLIMSAHELNIQNFIFLGSSCIYPKYSKQPIKENYLLSGELEPTNEWYAIAKISGVKLIQSLRRQYNRKNYVSLMPTNLYGSNDNYDLDSSHVIPAMIRKFHDAKILNKDEVHLWGDGSPYREFLHVDDLAKAIIHAAEMNLEEHLYNVGYGIDISIKELAGKISKIINFNGKIIWDTDKPNGTPKKLLDSSKFLSTGWKPTIDLDSGISDTYNWFIKNYNL